MKRDIFVVRPLESARAIWICTQNVVVEQHMTHAECLDPLCICFHRARIGSDFVVWQDCA